MENQLVWADLPVKDMQRAIKFYSEVFEVHFETMEHGDTKTAFFPFGPGVASVALKESKESNPSRSGALVYLAGGDNLSISLSKVEAAGGEIELQKTSLGDHGFMATFIDSEGNKVALYSPN